MKKKSNFILYTICRLLTLIVLMSSCHNETIDVNNVMLRSDKTLCLKTSLNPISFQLDWISPRGPNPISNLALSESNRKRLQLEDTINKYLFDYLPNEYIYNNYYLPKYQNGDFENKRYIRDMHTNLYRNDPHPVDYDEYLSLLRNDYNTKHNDYAFLNVDAKFDIWNSDVFGFFQDLSLVPNNIIELIKPHSVLSSLYNEPIRYIANFHNGKLESEFSVFYGDSNNLTLYNQIILKESYKNGLRDGTSKIWSQSGQMRAELSFKEGGLNGSIILYHDDTITCCRKKCEMSFKNGVLDGDYKIWDINGERVVWKYYNNGIEEEYKYEEGNEVGFEESYKKKNEKGKADEIEVFDQLNKHYTNYLYGVGFDAPDNWIREEASGKHSILKISHPDSVLMFVINVVEVKKDFNENNDINSWTNFDQKNQEMYQTLVQLGKGPLDTDIRNYKCEKEYLLNHKAFKCQYEITRKYADNEYDVVKITYQIQKGNMSYTFLFDVPLVFYQTNPEYYDSVFEYAYFID